jgi:hypothetical protein
VQGKEGEISAIVDTGCTPRYAEDAVQRRLGANVRWESKPQSFGIILMLIPNESG